MTLKTKFKQNLSNEIENHIEKNLNNIEKNQMKLKTKFK
jgi:hypothetical protein